MLRGKPRGIYPHTNKADVLNTNIIVVNGNGQNKGGDVATEINYDYYNLFVMGGEEFHCQVQGSFIVPADRALMESINPELKKDLAPLSAEAIEMIKTFPALFCPEKQSSSGEGQTFCYGYVTDIIVQDNGVRIKYLPLNEYRLGILDGLLFELGIQGNPKMSELTRTHWTIKKIDMVDVLQNEGLRLLTY